MAQVCTSANVGPIIPLRPLEASWGLAQQMPTNLDGLLPTCSGCAISRTSKIPVFKFMGDPLLLTRFIPSKHPSAESEKWKLDDGWPKSVEKHGLLLLVLRHCIARQYITSTRVQDTTLHRILRIVFSHTEPFTHRRFCTEAVTHRSFYIQRLLHTGAFTHRRFYTQKLLHREGFTHRH